MRVTRSVSANEEVLNPIKWTLPPPLLEKATARLGWVSLVAVASMVLLFAAEGLLQTEVGALRGTLAVRAVGLSILLLSAAYFALSHFGLLSKSLLLRAGLLYQLGIAFCIAMFENALPVEDALVRGVSNVGVWICMCGTLIPNTPIASLVSSLGCASMWGLAHWLSCRFHGYEVLPPRRLLSWMAPLALCALWVFLLNRRLLALQWKQQRAEELGSYHLAHRIGEGGMGEVWRASHRTLARNCAVKLIRAELLCGQSGRRAELAKRRFEREARVTARLKSPHTVALYDFGVAQDGSIFYAMELLDGLDLQTLVERFGPLPPSRVVHILRQVCSSLEEAHRAGLVHRDIKPRNIFLCNAGMEFDFTKVLDFGLVKSRAGFGENGADTSEGMVAGTPAYMPPELALGEPDLDGRADIYALGCVAYFLLTGALVFDEKSNAAMAMAHVNKEVVPPSQRSELPLPTDLEQLILQCLSKIPTHRPPTARALSKALSELHAQNGLPLWTPSQAEDWWQLHAPPSALSPSYGSPQAPAAQETLSAVEVALARG